MEMTKPILRVRDLKKYFPIYSGILRHQVGAVKAVDGIDFDLYPGEVLGVVGESGSGKSTVGRCVIRLIEPTAGEVIFEDINLLTLHDKKLKQMRKELQIVFQDPYSSLNPRKSIGESLGEAVLYHGIVKNREELPHYLAETLHQVGLDPNSMNRYPHEFSGGQQQRICIGRAIALKPKLIVCDEPVSALDVSVQAQILNLLIDLKERLGLSYLFISHDLSIIRHICDRVIVMHLGKAVESGSVSEIFNDPKHAYTKKLLAAIPIDHPKKKVLRV